MNGNGQNGNGHRRAVLYARVSSDEQAREGKSSLPQQIVAMRRYASQHGMEVVAEFREDFTGKVINRPELNRARDLIRSGGADAFIVHLSDRLGRVKRVSNELREWLQQHGAEVHTVTRGRSEDTPEGRLTDGVFDDLAQFEYENLIRRLKEGKRGKAKAGKWVGAGYAPYGYRARGRREERRLEIDEEEAAIVRRIFALYVGLGGLRNESLQGIARILTAEKIPGPAGGVWHTHTLRTLLDRRAYIGEFNYAGHTIELPELAIVGRDVFKRVQQQRKLNKARARRNARRPYLLTGHFKCGCGGGMMSHMHVNSGPYYECRRQNHNPHLDECQERSVRAEKVEAVVWEWLVELLSDDARLDKGLRRMAERREIELSPKRERLNVIEKLLADSEKKVELLAQDLAELTGQAGRAALKAQIENESKLLEQYTEERDLLLADLGQGEISVEDQTTIREIARDIRAELGQADYETKRFILGRLNVLVQLRTDDAGRWLDCTCGIVVSPRAIEVPSSRTASCAPRAGSAGRGGRAPKTPPSWRR